MAYRVETDSLGVIETSADRCYGAQTDRALRHFGIGEEFLPQEIIWALSLVKKAVALTAC